MSWIKNLRTACGLSQTKLCYWLQLPKSTLAMAESGQRHLPSSSHLKLARLYAAMQQPEPVAAAAAAKPAPLKTWRLQALSKKINRDRNELRFKTFVVEKSIGEWESRQQQREKMRLLLASLSHLHEVTPPPEHEAHWLQRRKEDLQAMDEKENNYEYRLLLLRREMLQLETGKLEELLQTLQEEYLVDTI